MSRASLSELEAVATVARAGGFRAAARELGVSSSALSHSIAALEGPPPRAPLQPDDAQRRTDGRGRDLRCGSVAPALALIDGALRWKMRARASSEISGVLRINTSREAAGRCSSSRCSYAICAVTPVLNWRSPPRMIDVLGQGFDAGLRLADTVPPDMIAVPIHCRRSDRWLSDHSAYFVGRKRALLVPSDLMRHQCIRARMGTWKALPLGIRKARPSKC